MVVTTYVPHLIYSVALTSIAVNLVHQKRTNAEERVRVETRISLLQILAEALQSPGAVDDEGVARLKRLLRSHDSVQLTLPPASDMGWLDIFRRKKE
ncbi:hypothetical protein FISHEDRAFT_44028 [Fistulina hepatica ATCC 64428]|uniref:SMODS and SLOG-associating 2TM effector domain-containing protein n=1 Tax=Fistulina hepatica ATCC 64428 TaxID=1128425 RepID=A0A0D7AAJ5_9AGAR|nr:hypothetical protein FISHEDRAFT_44028 [Fistulina hepatica ATCC 64428]